MTSPIPATRARLRANRRLGLLPALLLAAGCATAGGTGTSAKGPAAPPAAGDTDAGVVRATLANGLEVVLVPDHLAPVVTMEVGYRAGSAEAPAGFPGTAHAVEHMMFRGSPTLSGDQLTDIIARLGGDMNAYTEEVATHYFITAPAADLSVLLHVGAARMGGMALTDAAWEKGRGAIEQEVADDQSDPTYLLTSRLQGILLAGTPYAQDALGSRPTFDRTATKMLQAFHDTWYAPNDAVLVLAGDVAPDAVLPEVRRLFGAIPRRTLPPHPTAHLSPLKATRFALESDQGYGLVALGFRLPGDQSPDYAAAVVLADILGSHRGPLYGLVVAGQALDADFAFSDYPLASTGFAYAAAGRSTDVDALAGLVRARLTRALKQGFSRDLVEGAKRTEITQAELNRNSMFGLADAWSQALVDEGRHSPEDDVRAIRAVTVAQVNAVARRYLDLDRAAVGVLHPQASGAAVRSGGGSAGGPEDFSPKHTTGAALPAWAATDLARLEVPRQTLHPVVTTLANGLKLIVVPTSASDTVSVYGRVKQARELAWPKGLEGIDLILDQVFNAGGTATLDAAAFQKALDDIGALETAGRDFHVQALASHFDRAVDLLAAQELDPQLTDATVATARATMSGYVGTYVKSPNYLDWLATQRALAPPHDPTVRRITARSVAAATPADVRAYYHRTFRPELTTLVVVGKVDVATAQRVVTKYFGGWKAPGKAAPTELPPIPLNRPSKAVVPDDSRKQDKVDLSETLGLNRLDPDYYALDLGNAVLGGGFNASRLYDDLRVHGGLVYYVWSHLDLDRTRGTYTVEFGCDPPNVARVRAVVARELTRMARTPVTAVELERARSIRVRQAALEDAGVGQLADGLLTRSLLGLPLDEPTVAARHYLALDAKAIQAAFRKWIDPGRLVEVVQGPAPR